MFIYIEGFGQWHGQEHKKKGGNWDGTEVYGSTRRHWKGTGL